MDGEINLGVVTIFYFKMENNRTENTSVYK